MISTIRLISQQLAEPQLTNPKDLVSWMGAIQGQSYEMAKWAVGIRLKNVTINEVNQALNRGDIIRTHVLRPTWHLVAAEDIRWMLNLSRKRIASAFESYRKDVNMPVTDSVRMINQVGKMLEGGCHLTKQEITERLMKDNSTLSERMVSVITSRAEIDGLICSGADNGKKTTFALMDERVPQTKELHEEEALAELAIRYFQSHSPATLADFNWWSGLAITQVRKAISLIEDQLLKEKCGESEYYIHTSYHEKPAVNPVVHLLPSYDEFLISYKDRTDCIALEHYPKAFNNYGIFQPVILCHGKVIGNWSKVKKKNETVIESAFFQKHPAMNKKLLNQAIESYKEFWGLK